MKISVLIILLLCSPALLFADVIRMQNGEVYLGNITSTDSEGINIESFGRTIKVPHKDLLRSEKDLTALKNKQSEIILKDGSRLRGRVENYDEEVGVLVNIEFGSLTLPVQSIQEINDPVQKKFYSGNPVQIGLGAGYYSLTGKSKDAFDAGYYYSLFAEFNTSIISGLFIGADLSYFPFEYKDSSKVKYSIFTLQPYLSYRFLFLRRSSSLLRGLVPFVNLGTGAGYVLLKDKRDNALASEKSEVDFVYSARLGLDYSITSKIIIRLAGGWQSVAQKSESLNAFIANAGILYSF